MLSTNFTAPRHLMPTHGVHGPAAYTQPTAQHRPNRTPCSVPRDTRRASSRPLSTLDRDVARRAVPAQTRRRPPTRRFEAGSLTRPREARARPPSAAHPPIRCCPSAPGSSPTSTSRHRLTFPLTGAPRATSRGAPVPASLI